MHFTSLQKYILLYCHQEKSNKVSRGKLLAFYENQKTKPKKDDQVNIITKCLERLIDKELLIGYGVRTPHKWFIKEIKLTDKGQKAAKQIIKEKQLKLPLKLRGAKRKITIS